MTQTHITQENGMREKLLYLDTLLPDHLVDLYSVRQNMIRVP
jgi:hypothetical protein